MKIEIADVSYSYNPEGLGKHDCIKNINLSIPENRITTILGHSGSGKSTLLRIIGGLLLSQSGAITIDGKPITGFGKDRAIVSANMPLFPWMTAEKNISFALKQYISQGVKEKTDEIISRLEIGYFKHKYPAFLSSGMAKQVMLARALVIPSNILLLDEPLAEIDPQKRAFYHETLLQESKNKTILLVTHDLEEAIKLSSYIYLLDKNRGTITQSWNLEAQNHHLRDDEKLKKEVLSYYHDQINLEQAS